MPVVRRATRASAAPRRTDGGGRGVQARRLRRRSCAAPRARPYRRMRTRSGWRRGTCIGRCCHGLGRCARRQSRLSGCPESCKDDDTGVASPGAASGNASGRGPLPAIASDDERPSRRGPDESVPSCTKLAAAMRERGERHGVRKSPSRGGAGLPGLVCHENIDARHPIAAPVQELRRRRDERLRRRSRQAAVAPGRLVPAPGVPAVTYARRLQRGVRCAIRTSSPVGGGAARAGGGTAARGAVVSLAARSGAVGTVRAALDR